MRSVLLRDAVEEGAQHGVKRFGVDGRVSVEEGGESGVELATGAVDEVQRRAE